MGTTGAQSDRSRNETGWFPAVTAAPKRRHNNEGKVTLQSISTLGKPVSPVTVGDTPSYVLLRQVHSDSGQHTESILTSYVSLFNHKKTEWMEGEHWGSLSDTPKASFKSLDYTGHPYQAAMYFVQNPNFHVLELNDRIPSWIA